MKPTTTLFLKAAFWCALLLLTVLSLLPVEHLPEHILDIWDKAQHATGFAILAALGALAFPSLVHRVGLGLLLHGGFIELAQAYTGWRYGDWQDWLADGIGILLGTLLIATIARWRQARTG